MFKVYLVDDEQPIIDEMLTIIDWQSLNCEVCGHNTDSIIALEEIRDKKPDILVSDINMPGINGLELVSILSKERSDLGVILLSAYDLFDYAAEAIKLRVLSYLVKPVNKREFCSVVTEYQKSRANYLFHDFFRMIINSSVDEKIIKRVESECINKSFIKEGKRYAFVLLDSGEEIKNVIAEFKEEDINFVLFEADDLDQNSLMPYKDSIFLGGESFYRCAKFAFESKIHSLDEKQLKKEIKIAIDKIIDDIEVNFHEKISLGYYASKYHYNLTYLSQQFKTYVGMNFIDYLIKVRLEKAKVFMRDKTLNMNEIAYKLGYDDYSHFSKIFKKYEGLSPADYRKKYC